MHMLCLNKYAKYPLNQAHTFLYVSVYFSLRSIALQRIHLFQFVRPFATVCLLISVFETLCYNMFYYFSLWSIAFSVSDKKYVAQWAKVADSCDLNCFNLFWILFPFTQMFFFLMCVFVQTGVFICFNALLPENEKNNNTLIAFITQCVNIKDLLIHDNK